jgi:Ca2+-binding RTX toxin-like protein
MATHRVKNNDLLITDEVGHGSDTILLQGGGYVGIFADTASGNDSYVNTGANRFSAELYFGNFTTGLSLDFASGAASGLELGNDTIMGFTTITLGRGDDTVLGSSSRSETIDAHGGDDRLQGRGGRDWLDGSAGNDTLDGSAGADRLFAGFDANDGNDILKGRGGNDYLVSGADELGRGGGNDRMYGGAGNDTLKDGGGNDSMYGGAGDDWLTHTKGGNDQMYGGAGADVFSARGEFPTGDMADILDFEDGIDRIWLNEGFDISDAVQVGDDVEIGSLRIHNFTLAQLDLTDFYV